MTRYRWSLFAAVALAVALAFQVGIATRHAPKYLARADLPTVVAGVDVLAGIPEIPVRVRGNDYRRAAFGESWTDDTSAPGGRNGCDTRNDILDRDLVDKAYVAITRCPTAVLTGVLYDPYTNNVVNFTRGNQVGAAAQIDHILSAAVTAQPLVVTGQCVDDMPPTRSERRP